MKITTISYEKCHNLGNYEHEKVRMDAIVEEGDDPLQALDVLRVMVDGDIERADRLRELRDAARWNPFRSIEVGQEIDGPDGILIVREKRAVSLLADNGAEGAAPVELDAAEVNAHYESVRNEESDSNEDDGVEFDEESELDYDPIAEE